MMRLIRFMMILLGGLFLMGALRIIMQGFRQGVGGKAARQSVPGRGDGPEVTLGGELKKCVACGVYNSAGNSVTKVRGGVTEYYCSVECRAKNSATAA
jgi:hypothetical protein